MLKTRWKIVIGLAGALLLAGICVLLSRGGQPKAARLISLQSSGNDSAPLPQHANALKIAVGAIISPANSLVFYEDIFAYVGETLGQEVQMVQRKTSPTR